uniref:DEAD-box helicase 25 n=1 Tax=Nothoprocta perdicaria TaxID=30464 RepID=A0A8C7EFD6_NOTPE
MGFNRPSKIQETALPMMLAHPPQNLIAQSQSGTGKTAAFVLAMLSRVNTARCQPQCLCLAPTFELALQIGRVVERMGQFCADVKVTFAVQGNRVAPGTRLKEQIVIGTPGTVLDWCFKRRLLDPGTISVFVLDEADIMIDTQGFCSQSIRVQRWARAPRGGNRGPGNRSRGGNGGTWRHGAEAAAALAPVGAAGAARG